MGSVEGKKNFRVKRGGSKNIKQTSAHRRKIGSYAKILITSNNFFGFTTRENFGQAGVSFSKHHSFSRRNNPRFLFSNFGPRGAKVFDVVNINIRYYRYGRIDNIGGIPSATEPHFYYCYIDRNISEKCKGGCSEDLEITRRRNKKFFYRSDSLQ